MMRAERKDFLLVIVLAFFGNVLCTNRPMILWDPRNYLFSCNNPKIYVKVMDTLQFTCPNENLNFQDVTETDYKKLNENIYILRQEQMEDFKACNATAGRLIQKCKARQSTGEILKTGFFTLTIKTHVSDPVNFVAFTKGKDYYFIGTSDGTENGLENKIGGHCQSSGEGLHRLRLTVHVCTDEEINENRCPTCDTLSCYEKGCGTFNDWNESENSPTKYMWNGTQCYQHEARQCNSTNFQCGSGPYQRYSPVNKTLCTLNEKTCPSPSISPTPSTSIEFETSNIIVNSTAIEECSCTPSTCIQPSVSSSSQYIFNSSTQIVNETTSVMDLNKTSSALSIFTTLTPSCPTQTVVTTQVVNSNVVTTIVAPSISITTVTKTEVVTRTAVSTSIKDCSSVPTKIPINCPTQSPSSGQMTDINYDSKFYITVVAAIMGAILVGVFVTHAFVVYYSKKKAAQTIISRQIRDVNNPTYESKKITLTPVDT